MTVLVGFAPTPEGRAAVRRALTECGLRRAQLVLVSSERAGADPVEAAALEREIASACAELSIADPGHEVRVFTGSVEPADDILDVAQERNAELIVIGLRRRTPVGKLILGQSAQRILLEAGCPVMAVKGSSASAQPSGQPSAEASR